MVRLHWVWRGAIAVLVGGLCSGIWRSPPLHGVRGLVGYPIARPVQLALLRLFPKEIAEPLAITAWQVLVDCPPVVIPALLTYLLLAQRYGPRQLDDETRCRKCGYILRGITEPRCPECGERI